MTLTDTAIKAMLPGDVLRDDDTAGLSIRCRPTGKSFMLYYRTRGGDERRPKIGDYDPEGLTLSKARKIAKNMLAKVANGEDPSLDRQDARKAPTIAELWDRCEREHYTGAKDWHHEAKRLYGAHIAPALGKKRVAAIEFEDVDWLYRSLAKTPSEANHTLAVLSKMLQLAEKWRYRKQGTNVVRLVDNRFPSKKRRRYARPDELAKLGPVLDAYADRCPASVAFLYVLAFTGARPSEIGRAPPSILEAVVIDGQRFGVLRIDEGKTGARDVFLPPQAMRVIDKLPKGRKTLTGRQGVPRTLWDSVRAAAGCTDLWARDFRRTFASVGLSNGLTGGQIGELLGHRSAETTKIYTKLLEDPARRAAAEIAAKVEEMMTGGGG